MRQRPRIVMLMICLAIPLPGVSQQPEFINFWRMQQRPSGSNTARDIGWYPCPVQTDHCIRVTTEHGLTLRDAQIQSRQDADRRVLLDVIASLDSRIAELEIKIAALEATK